MSGSITMLLFRNEECEKEFWGKVPPLPVCKFIRKNHGGSPHVMVRLCEEYGMDVKKLCVVDVPGRKELE